MKFSITVTSGFLMCSPLFAKPILGSETVPVFYASKPVNDPLVLSNFGIDPYVSDDATQARHFARARCVYETRDNLYNEYSKKKNVLILNAGAQSRAKYVFSNDAFFSKVKDFKCWTGKHSTPFAYKAYLVNPTPGQNASVTRRDVDGGYVNWAWGMREGGPVADYNYNDPSITFF